MQYRKQIPSKLADENENVDSLINVMDGFEQAKTEVVEKAVRFNKAPLLTDLRWLRKKAEDLGWPPIPDDFTKEQLDAMILNAEHVMALKGSKQGLHYWLWVLTFGNITIDDSAFYPLNKYIIPSDDFYGYVSHFEPLEDYDLFLFSDVSDFGTQTLTVGIETKYHYMRSLRDYIINNLQAFISFVDDSFTFNLSLEPGVYNTYSEPYQYFVIP